MNVYSPLVKNQKSVLVESLDKSIIADRYAKECKIDVSPYFKNKSVDIYQCPVSGYRFYFPKELMADGAFYEHLEDISSGGYYSKRWEHDEAIKFINSTDSVLEIGCGSGKFLKMCRDKNVKHISAIDLNSQSITRLKEEGFDASLATIEEYKTANENKRFSIICAFQVLEHVYEVYEFLSSAFALLQTKGKLIIAVPNNNPYFFKHDKYHTLNLPPHHMGMWDERSLKYIAQLFNVDVASYKTEPLHRYKEWFNVQKRHLISKGKLYKILDLVPRPIYKFVLKLFASQIEGAYSLIVFQKNL
jgi:2-polyprenyl-3-methyl-5-hydroxy-6-metoxy-1,4-benzoquinol methylase